MVQISHKKLPEEILSRMFTMFFQVVGNKRNYEEFQAVIDDLFSETEQVMVIKRIAIVYLLLKGVSSPAIAEALSVSPGTVSKFYLLKSKDHGLVQLLRKIVRNDKMAEFIEGIFLDLFHQPGFTHTNWSNDWKLRLDFQKRKQRGI